MSVCYFSLVVSFIASVFKCSLYRTALNVCLIMNALSTKKAIPFNSSRSPGTIWKPALADIEITDTWRRQPGKNRDRTMTSDNPTRIQLHRSELATSLGHKLLEKIARWRRSGRKTRAVQICTRVLQCCKSTCYIPRDRPIARVSLCFHMIKIHGHSHTNINIESLMQCKCSVVLALLAMGMRAWEKKRYTESQSRCLPSIRHIRRIWATLAAIMRYSALRFASGFCLCPTSGENGLGPQWDTKECSESKQMNSACVIVDVGQSAIWCRGFPLTTAPAINMWVYSFRMVTTCLLLTFILIIFRIIIIIYSERTDSSAWFLLILATATFVSNDLQFMPY